MFVIGFRTFFTVKKKPSLSGLTMGGDKSVNSFVTALYVLAEHCTVAMERYSRGP